MYRLAIYSILMIRSFKNSSTERLFHGERDGRLPPQITHVAIRKLLMINAALDVENLRVPPGNRLEKLSGDRKGQWSVRINDQWRVCFLWNDGSADLVEIVDYH